jgi:hypothetical protein
LFYFHIGPYVASDIFHEFSAVKPKRASNYSILYQTTLCLIAIIFLNLVNARQFTSGVGFFGFDAIQLFSDERFLPALGLSNVTVFEILELLKLDFFVLKKVSSLLVG